MINPRSSDKWKRYAISITLRYIAAGLAWTFVSDGVVAVLFSASPASYIVDLIKGLGFVALTAWMLYRLLAWKLLDTQRIERMMKNLVESMDIAVGDEFFRSMTKQLTHTLHVSHAFVGRPCLNKENTLHIIAARIGDEIRENLDYELEGPSQIVLQGKQAVCYNGDVQSEFPGVEYLKELDVQTYIGSPIIGFNGEVLGMVVVLHTGPVENPKIIQSMLEIFSRRVLSELERKLSEDQLKRAYEQFQLAAAANNCAVYDYDVERDMIYWACGLKEVFGYSIEGTTTDSQWWKNQLHPDDEAQGYRAYLEHIERNGEHFHEYRFRHADGTYRYVWDRCITVLHPETGQIQRIVGSMVDITDRKQVEEKMNRLAYYDPLTGLPNRRMFMDELHKALTRTDQGFAVISIDLDRFKLINETLGHQVGDRVLIHIAQLIKSQLPHGAILARFSGDEYVILMPLGDRGPDISKQAQSFIDIVNSNPVHDEQELYVSISMGIAVYPTDSDQAEALIQNSQTALHRAKEAGRKQYCFFTNSMNTLASERVALEHSLRKAIERDEFILYYQPQVDVRTGEVLGLEALIRWEHPELGLVSPGHFIPLAEETGFITEIGEWVLERACTQAREWLDEGYPPVHLSVNLSALQLRQKEIVHTIEKVLEQTQFPGYLLGLELTESVMMLHTEENILLLKKLRELGIQISIDDFGTGYSSLSYLKRFPIDIVKLDRSFLAGMSDHGEDTAIVAAMIQLAHSLNKKVVAEGVETKEQARFLKETKCDLIQGFFYSPPLPANEIVKLMGKPEQKPLSS